MILYESNIYVDGTAGLSEFFIGNVGEPGLHLGRVTAVRTSLDSEAQPRHAGLSEVAQDLD